MDHLKFRVELNKGKPGISLQKLENVAKNMLVFLSDFSKDIGIERYHKDWFATNFENNSVDFDVANFNVRDQETINKSRHSLRKYFSGELMNESDGDFKPETYENFSNILNTISEEEEIRFGVYDNGSEIPSEWYNHRGINKPKKIKKNFVYLGEIQGTSYSFIKGKQPYEMTIKDSIYNHSIKCTFDRSLYEKAAETFFNKDGSFVFISGKIYENIETSKIEKIEATDFTLAPKFNKELYDRNIGHHPNLTGDKNTQEYMDEIRKW